MNANVLLPVSEEILDTPKVSKPLIYVPVGQM